MPRVNHAANTQGTCGCGKAITRQLRNEEGTLRYLRAALAAYQPADHVTPAERRQAILMTEGRIDGLRNALAALHEEQTP
jgi:hypothetical protein